MDTEEPLITRAQRRRAARIALYLACGWLFGWLFVLLALGLLS